MSTESPALKAPGPSRRLELFAYVAVALVGIAPAFSPGHVVGDGVDLYGTIWFYWWIAHCLGGFLDPSWTDLFFHPLGKDIFSHTGNNFLDALFSVPFQWIFGSPAYQKWVVFSILVLNALSFRVLARGLFSNPWAVFGATLAWELNPYGLFELTAGRPTQAFLFFLPLAVHAFLQLPQREGREGWCMAAACGVATALQAWTYWFMGWFMALLFAWLALVDLWRHPTRRSLVLRYALAGGVCLLLVAPAAWQMSGLASTGAVPGLSAGTFSLTQAPQALSNNVAATLHGYLLLETVGAPMFSHLSWGLPVLAFVLWGRDRARWAPALVILLAWAIGPVLPMGPGKDPLVLPHYMAAYHALPFFDRLWFPYRLLSVAMLVASVMIGFVLERGLEARRIPVHRAGWLVLAWAVWTAAEQHRYRIYPFVTRDLTPPETVQWLADQEGAVLHLPFGVTHRSIVWQTVHELPMFGGMGENAPLLWPEGFKNRLRNSFVRTLVRATRKPGAEVNYHPAQRAKLEEEGFRWVMLHRDLVELELPRWTRDQRMTEEERIAGQQEVTRQLVEILGDPTAVENEIVTWDLQGLTAPPEGISYQPGRLEARTWDSDQMSDYERVLRDEGRIREGPAPGVGNKPRTQKKEKP